MRRLTEAAENGALTTLKGGLATLNMYFTKWDLDCLPRIPGSCGVLGLLGPAQTH